MQGETPLEKDPRIKSEDDEGGAGDMRHKAGLTQTHNITEKHRHKGGNKWRETGLR